MFFKYNIFKLFFLLCAFGIELITKMREKPLTDKVIQGLYKNCF